MKGEKRSITDKFYRAIESLADGILRVNQGGAITHVSHNFSNALGYDRKELLGRAVFDIEFHSNGRSYPHYWRRLRKGETIRRQTFFLSSKEKLQPATVQMSMVEEGAALWLILFQSFPWQNYELLGWSAGRNAIAAWEWDLLRGSLVVTPSLYRLFHLPKHDTFVHRDNIIGLLKERLSSDQVIWLTRALGQLHETRQSLEQKLFFKWKGSVKELIFHAEVVVEGDQVIRIRGFFREEAPASKLKEELADHRMVLDKMADIVCWLAPDYRFHYVNPAAVQQLGYDEAELLGGLRIMDVEAESTHKEWEDRWAELEEREVMQVEGSFQRKQGSVFPVEMQLTRIRSGDKVLVSLIARDISQQRSKEARLRRALVEIDNLSRQLKEENIYLQREVSSRYNFENIISQSPQYKKVLDQIRQVAPTDSTVLILGETGTGKELLARAIHRRSGRSKRPLIKVDCGTLPKHLIESELFGHEKGAFTGAVKEKAGRFELADGGTLFLDEIGELPLELQPKLLRVLQEGEFTRVGGNDVFHVDVRIIVATNRNLKERVEAGDFRSDLYYRINIFPIYNLPLRERPEDIPLLAEHFLKKYREKIGRKVLEIPSEAMNKLMRYNYPGNIRELESIIERAVILNKGEQLSLDHWDPDTGQQAPPPAKTEPPAEEEELLSFEAMQRLHILKALEKTNWKVSGEGGAAELLDLNPQTLYSKMKKLGINR